MLALSDWPILWGNIVVINYYIDSFMVIIIIILRSGKFSIVFYHKLSLVWAIIIIAIASYDRDIANTRLHVYI